MKKLSCILGTFLCALMVQAGTAQAAYPEKPINMVIPYGTGGASDLGGRALAMSAAEYLGQPIMVSNQPGASGTTGSFKVLKSKADGYTVLLSRVSSQAMYPAQKIKNKLYEWDSFDILTIIEVNPYVIAVRDDSPYKTLDDLGAAIKANPGKLKFAHSGVGTPLYLGPQMLSMMAGGKPTDVVGVPFKADGDSKMALMGGQVDFLFVNLAGLVDQIKAGSLRALGICRADRHPDFPNMPCTAEMPKYKDLAYLAGWSGLYAPKGLPADVTKTWTDVIQKVAKDQKWVDLCKKRGAEPMMTSPEESKAFVQKQVELFRQIYSTME